MQSSSSSDKKLESLELLTLLVTFPKISSGLLRKLSSLISSSSAIVTCGVSDRLMVGDGSISTVDEESQRLINSVSLIVGLRHLRLGGATSVSFKGTPVFSSK